MRILWVSDSSRAVSAYGQQTGLFLPRLLAAGHDVVLLATGNGHLHRLENGIRVLPVVGDQFGNTIVSHHVRELKIDLVITLLDPHVLNAGVYNTFPWCAWAPLDFETPTRATLAQLSAARWIWSPSSYGMSAYRCAGVKDVTHIPHGVDSTLFVPATTKTKGEFLAVSVGANRSTPSRKGFFELLSAWKIFSDAHADAKLYMHTDRFGVGGGENLDDIMHLIGLDPDRVAFPNWYMNVCGTLDPKHLATMYAGADVFISASHGEGFGIPALEAQMCGTPVILPRNTAQTELCLTGHLVDTVPYMPFDGATTWRRPSIDGLVEALEVAYIERGRVRPQVRERVLAYDIDRVFNEHMLPALNQIAKEIS